MELSDAITPDDAVLNIKGDLLGIVTNYGGERIVAGPRMESMIDELFDYVMSERSAAFRARAESDA